MSNRGSLANRSVFFEPSGAISMFSICIPTYNRLKDLKSCLASVFAAAEFFDADEPVEVLVSDNASSDGTGDWISQVNPKSPKIRFSAWTNSENIGAVKNIKKLLDNASEEYLFLLTDDDLVFPSVFNVIKRYIDSDSPSYIKVAIASYLTKNKVCYYYGSKSDLNDKNNPSNFIEIAKYSHVLSGCVIRNSSNIFQQLKLSNNAYPSIELCALSAGKCLFISEPLVWHQWENQIFWELDVDMTSELSRAQQSSRDAQLALSNIPDGFLDPQAIHLLYANLLKSDGYIETDIEELFGKPGWQLFCKAHLVRVLSIIKRGLLAIFRTHLVSSSKCNVK